MKRISLLVLAGLVAGIIVGEMAKASANPTVISAVEVIEAFGGLWLNTLRMTVVPLVVSLLIVGVASVADTAKTGGLVARAVLLFTFLIFLAGAYATAAMLGLLELWPVDGAAAQAFVASVGGDAVTITEPPTFVSWLQGLAPSNPVTAAAEDAVLQVVVFSIFFGFAVTKLDVGLRDPIVTFFRAVSAAMIVIVRWVLIAGPFGVFALGTGVGLRAGFEAAGVLTQYVIIVSAVTLGITIVAWLLAVSWGRQPIGRFTAAAAPVWAIAVSTQSSLASLPAMLDAALRGLDIPARIADVVLPLAVAVFRFTSPVANLAVVYFCAHLYGIEPTPFQIGVGLVVAYAVSIAAVGLPGQVSFIASIAPICLAMGVPTELLGILIAVEIIPDIFRTLGNVTGDLAATAILSRKDKPDTDAAA
ncbi:dicarboxylate/amino acid:cation symporter [Vitreimonas sp.]|uniref:dicarboxylate/amino acid:cation symporter n=1 Tax=Vitreimonas sp. TaxID=3069702 RepID=UPI002ED88556